MEKGKQEKPNKAQITAEEQKLATGYRSLEALILKAKARTKLREEARARQAQRAENQGKVI